MGRVAELVIGWSDLVEQEDLASSPGAGRDREQARVRFAQLCQSGPKFGKRFRRRGLPCSSRGSPRS